MVSTISSNILLGNRLKNKSHGRKVIVSAVRSQRGCVLQGKYAVLGYTLGQYGRLVNKRCGKEGHRECCKVTKRPLVLLQGRYAVLGYTLGQYGRLVNKRCGRKVTMSAVRSQRDC